MPRRKRLPRHDEAYVRVCRTCEAQFGCVLFLTRHLVFRGVCEGCVYRLCPTCPKNCGTKLAVRSRCHTHDN